MIESSGQQLLEIPKDFVGAATLFKKLFEERSFRKELLESPALVAAIKLLAERILDGKAQERLEAVSIFGKAAEVSKPVAAAIQPVLKSVLMSRLPPTGSWGSADDRYYLAKGVAAVETEWVQAYAATELAQADVTEKKSRSVWADLAISRAHSLSDALRTVSKAFATDMSSFNDSVDTAYRKLSRITSALSDILVVADVPTGEGFGKAFADLVLQAGGMKGSETAKLRKEAALTTLDLIVQILRLRFDVLLDADFYHSVRAIRGWWRPGRPPQEVEAKADRIATLAVDGLHILARQRITDDAVRQSLVAAVGADRINNAGHAIAAKDPSLEPDISNWLATGRVLTAAGSNEGAQAVTDFALDELLAKLLIALDSLEGGPQALEGVADSIDILEPAHAAVIRTAAARSRLIAQWAHALATKRNLALFGSRGELLNFDPALHEALGEIPRLSIARVRVPGIKKQLKNRPATIVSKAQVEKAWGDIR